MNCAAREIQENGTEFEMLTDIHIKNFRGFADLKVGPLKRVNLIIGQNNTGKTGLLEALALLLAENSTPVPNLPNLFRSTGGDEVENFWKWLFRNRDASIPVELAASFGDGFRYRTLLGSDKLLPPFVEAPSHTTHQSFSSQPGSATSFNIYAFGAKPGLLKAGVVSTHPTDPNRDAIDYNRVIVQRKKKQVVELLKKIDPRLAEVEALNLGSGPLLYADVGLSEMIPVSQLGQGFSRLLDVYSKIITSEFNVLLIDEIENGLHHSVLVTIWRGLLNAAKEMDVQVFATSHSYECIRAAHEAFAERPDYDLALHRLDEVNGVIKATTYDKETLETSLESNFEIR
jgi:hypothetical protein